MIHKAVEETLINLENTCGYVTSKQGQHVVEVSLYEPTGHRLCWCHGKGGKTRMGGIDSAHKYRLPWDWLERIHKVGWSYINGMICLEANRITPAGYDEVTVIDVCLAAQARGFGIYPIQAYLVQFADKWGFASSIKGAYQQGHDFYHRLLRDGHHAKTHDGPVAVFDSGANYQGPPTAKNRGLR